MKPEIKEQVKKEVLQEFGVSSLEELPTTLRKIAEHRINRKIREIELKDKKFVMKEEIFHEVPSFLQKKVPKTLPLYGLDALLAEAAIDPEGFYHVDENTKIDLNSPDMTVIKKLRTGEVVKMPLSEYLKVPEPLLPKEGESIPEFLARARAAEEEERRYALLHDLDYVSPFGDDKKNEPFFYYGSKKKKNKKGKHSKDENKKSSKKHYHNDKDEKKNKKSSKGVDNSKEQSIRAKAKAKKNRKSSDENYDALSAYIEDPIVKKVLEEKFDKTLSKHDKINNMEMTKSEIGKRIGAEESVDTVKQNADATGERVPSAEKNEVKSMTNDNSVSKEQEQVVDPETVIKDLGEYTMQFGLEHKSNNIGGGSMQNVSAANTASTSQSVSSGNVSTTSSVPTTASGQALVSAVMDKGAANTSGAQGVNSTAGVSVNSSGGQGTTPQMTPTSITSGSNVNGAATNMTMQANISGAANSTMNAQANTGFVGSVSTAISPSASSTQIQQVSAGNTVPQNVQTDSQSTAVGSSTNESVQLPDLEELRQRIQKKHIPGVDWDEPQWEDNENIPSAEPDVILDPSLAKYKILIIEDNSDVRYQYEYMLKREGFTVITAKNGEEGIVTAIKERPQLILLDILMPEVDGWEVLKALREYTSTYKPKIMITSNLGAPEDIEKAYKLGADLFVIKADTTLQDLINKVKQMLFQSDHKKVYLLPLNFNTPEVKDLLANTYPELRTGRCPSCGGPIGLKLIPVHKQDPALKRTILEFSARYVCLRCGKEWV